MIWVFVVSFILGIINGFVLFGWGQRSERRRGFRRRIMTGRDSEFGVDIWSQSGSPTKITVYKNLTPIFFGHDASACMDQRRVPKCRITEEWGGHYIGRKHCHVHGVKWEEPVMDCPRKGEQP